MKNPQSYITSSSSELIHCRARAPDLRRGQHTHPQPPPSSPLNANDYSICSSEESKVSVDAKLLHNPPALHLTVALPLLLRLEWAMTRGIAELEIGAWWAEEICDSPEYRALEEEAIPRHRLQQHLVLRSAPIFNSFDSPSGFIRSNVMADILTALRLSGILMGDILILTRISPPPAFPLLRLATSIFGYAHGVIGLSNTVADLRLLLPKYC